MARSENKQSRLRILVFVVIQLLRIQPEGPGSRPKRTIFLQYRVLVPKSANQLLSKVYFIL